MTVECPVCDERGAYTRPRTPGAVQHLREQYGADNVCETDESVIVHPDGGEA